MILVVVADVGQHASISMYMRERLRRADPACGLHYRVAKNVGRLGLDWFGPGESGWTSSTRFVILVA